MNSSEECHQYELLTTKHRRSSKTKLLLSTIASLLLAAVVVCAVVGLSSSASAPPAAPDVEGNEEALTARSLKQPEPQENVANDDKSSKSESEIPKVRSARYLKFVEMNDTEESNEANTKSTLQVNTNPSCFSDVSNKTIPAAHIKGHGLKFSSSVPGSVPSGYQQRWRCTEIQNGPFRQSVHAFVDGGMCFNQTDKTLRVPTCGYYMVTSQVLFNIHSLEEPKTVYHLMRFKRNCPGSYSTDAQSIVVTGKSSMSPFTVDNHHAGVATTYTSDVIKLCTGGSIWIEIPDGDNGAPCCPTGDPHGTFITAVLVSETSCHWPPDTKMSYLDPTNA